MTHDLLCTSTQVQASTAVKDEALRAGRLESRLLLLCMHAHTCTHEDTPLAPRYIAP